MMDNSMPITSRARIGLALSGGAALGWAHIGVIQALEQADLQADIVTGTSMGAIIGACYADNKMDVLLDHATEMRISKLFQLMDVRFWRGGLLGGDRIKALLEQHFGRKTVADMARPFATVATDLVTGQPVILDQGPVVDAVRASIAIPGMFQPVIQGDKLLVDGQISVPVPVRLARDLGADLVIAVDVMSDYQGRTKQYRLAEKIAKKGRVDMASVGQAAYALLIRQFGQAGLDREPPDILIQPKTGDLRPIDFIKVQACIDRGYAAGQEALPQIRSALLGKHSSDSLRSTVN